MCKETLPKSVKPLISQSQIQEQIRALGAQISKDFEGDSIVFLVVLKGAFIFAADLIRQVYVDARIDFIQVASYDGGTSSSGMLRLLKEPQVSLQGKNVVIVEDIVDTGLTMQFLLDWLHQKGVQSVRTASLLFKPSRQKVPTHIDYLGFTIDDVFVVGYGLDFNQSYRNLPFIGTIHESESTS